MRIKSTLLAVAAGALIGCGFVLVKKHHDHSPFSEQEQRLVWDALTCSGKLVFDCDGETTTLGACASRMVWHVHVTQAALCLDRKSVV